MPDDRMRIIAELLNKVSDPMKRMQRDVESFAKAGKDMQNIFKKFGPQLVDLDNKQRRHSRETLPQFRREMEALRDAFKKILPQFSDVTDKVSAFGLGAGTAIGSITAFGAAIYETGKSAKEFSESMRALRFASQESGYSISQIKQLDLAAGQFGLSAEQMRGAAKSFTESMVLLHKHNPEMIRAILPTKQFGTELWRMAIAGKYGAENMGALFRAMDNIKKAMPGTEGQVISGRLAKAFGLPPELARLNEQQFNEIMKITKDLGPDPYKLKEATEQASKLNKELLRTSAIFESWKVSIGTELSAMFDKLLNKFNDAAGHFRPNAGSGIPSQSILGRMLGKKPNFNERFYFDPNGLGAKPFGTGGIVSEPTLAFIGERGPEAVIPLTGSGFDPFAASAALVAQIFGDSGAGNVAALAAGKLGPHHMSGGGSGKLGALAGLGLGGQSGGGLGAMGTVPRHLRQPGGGRAELGKHLGMVRGGARHRLGMHLGMDQGASGGLSSTGDIDRSSFNYVLNDPAFVARMASMGKGEVGLKSNLKTQRAIAEQAFNRWYVRKQPAGTDLYHGRGGYYAANTFRNVSKEEVERYKRDVLIPVIRGGTNEAFGTTGNASNEPGNMVAMHQFGRHTPGFWMDLKTGQKTDLPPSYMKGQAEAMFMEGPFKRQLAHADGDRRTLASNSAQQVEGTGQLDVHVTAPAGTKVNAKGGGIFQKTNIQRNIQNFPASAGPIQDYSGFDLPWNK